VEVRTRAHEDNLDQGNRRNLVQNLNTLFLSVDERGNIVPKTPEAALVAAQAYLLTTANTWCVTSQVFKISKSACIHSSLAFLKKALFKIFK
jgi:hypothetical protein